MPKQKTHKGVKKRFRTTATGKVKHRQAGTSHLAARKIAQAQRVCCAAPRYCTKSSRSRSSRCLPATAIKCGSHYCSCSTIILPLRSSPEPVCR